MNQDATPASASANERTADRDAFAGLKQALRWVVALPGGILAAILVLFPVHWGVMIVTSGTIDDDSLGISSLDPETLERIATAFFVPLTLIYVTARIAPRYRLQTAGVLSILWAMFIGAGFTYAASSGWYEDWRWIEFGAAIGAGLAGIICSLVAIIEFERDSNRPTYGL